MLDDKKIAEIQKNLEEKYILNPLAEDKEIEETSAVVARELALKADNTSRVEFQGETYTFKARHFVSNFKNLVTMFVINEEHKALADNAHQPYRPYMVTAEIENSMDILENIKAIVEAVFRHITGNVQPEVLPD